MKEKRVGNHTFDCEICSEMAKRGYRSEEVYWDHQFTDKLRPIKYKLIRMTNHRRGK